MNRRKKTIKEKIHFPRDVKIKEIGNMINLLDFVKTGGAG